MQAVLFDVYNTLLYIDPADYRHAKKRMAEMAGLPPDLFRHLWRGYTLLSNRGDLLTIEERVAVVLRDLERAPEPALVARMAAVERELQEELVRLGPHSLATLQQLREQGFRLGVVSNTGNVARRALQLHRIDSLFDAMVFSYEVRSVKPGLLLYRAACSRLGLAPEDCIYVGDGDDLEIVPAASLGMYTILLCESGTPEPRHEGQNADATIRSLDEVLPIAGRLRRGRP